MQCENIGSYIKPDKTNRQSFLVKEPKLLAHFPSLSVSTEIFSKTVTFQKSPPLVKKNKCCQLSIGNFSDFSK